MLLKATKIHEAVRRELERHDRALEVDITLSKIHLEIIMGRQSGLPVLVRYQAHSETDLTKEGK